MLAPAASAQTAFTYQGELRSGGSPAAGLYDLRFRLYDAASGGLQVGTTLCADNVTVVGGRFTVALDFGPSFTAARFLEVDVRQDSGLNCGSAAGFVTLTQRQAVTPAPSATHAATSGSAGNADQLGGQNAAFYLNAGNLTGTVSDARLSTNVPRLNAASTFSAVPAFNGGTTGSSAPFSVDSTFRVTNLNADLLDGLDSTSFALASHTHDASAIASGTLLDARLSTNIGRLNGNQNWTGSNVFSGNNSFSGDGAGLTNLNASQIGSGQVPDSRLPPTVARLASANTFTNAQTISTGAQFPFTVVGSSGGGAWLRLSNTSAGGREWSLISTGSGNGEGAGKLLVRDGSAASVRMAFDTDGDVGIGTVAPAGKLDLTASDPRFAIRNINDVGGGYIQQSGNALQLGLYNPSASGWGNVPANGFRAALGVDNTGRVGSLTNTGLAPTFRNILDDGSGNASIQGSITANNLPAIKVVSTDVAGFLESRSVTLIENITVNVPANGTLKITARCPAALTAYDTQTSTATLELKETTGAEVTIRQAVFSITPGVAGLAIAEWKGELTLEHHIPVSAGPRSFKLRLLHTDQGFSLNRVSYDGAEISVMYIPGSL
ncbi:MAG: hypothetical protein HEQ23_07340 [Tepidisphaera sp.]